MAGRLVSIEGGVKPSLYAGRLHLSRAELHPIWHENAARRAAGSDGAEQE